MSEALLLMIEKMIEDVKSLFDIATANKEQGLANFIADRQDKLQFWAWWLRSSIKSTIN
jgi:DNA-binding ferritin-like protein